MPRCGPGGGPLHDSNSVTSAFHLEQSHTAPAAARPASSRKHFAHANEGILGFHGMVMPPSQLEHSRPRSPSPVTGRFEKAHDQLALMQTKGRYQSPRAMSASSSANG